MGLIAPLGHVQLHLIAALFVQRLLQSVAVRRQLVHRNDLGDLFVIQIIPGQKFLPHGGNVRGIVEQKLPLIGQPSVPEAQHRRTHAVRRACQRHHIHLHIRVHNDLLPGAHLGDGCDLIPQQGRRLKFQPVRGLLHPLIKDLQDVLFAIADQVHGALDGLIVVFAADSAAAHCHALADVCIQAGPSFADLLREALIAARQQKGIHGRFRHLPGRKAGGIGADILGIVLLLLQHEGEPGPWLLCHLDIAVAFIILEQDVILRRVGLDLAGFQHQRFKLALADDHVKGIGMGDHLADLVVVGHALAEILAHPDAQPLCLADINDGVRLIPDDINAGQQRQHTGFLIQFSFGHGFSLKNKKRQVPPPLHL